MGGQVLDCATRLLSSPESSGGCHRPDERGERARNILWSLGSLLGKLGKPNFQNCPDKASTFNLDMKYILASQISKIARTNCQIAKPWQDIFHVQVKSKFWEGARNISWARNIWSDHLATGQLGSCLFPFHPFYTFTSNQCLLSRGRDHHHHHHVYLGHVCNGVGIVHQLPLIHLHFSQPRKIN